jgi:hypothetical protein
VRKLRLPLLLLAWAGRGLEGGRPAETCCRPSLLASRGKDGLVSEKELLYPRRAQTRGDGPMRDMLDWEGGGQQEEGSSSSSSDASRDGLRQLLLLPSNPDPQRDLVRPCSRLTSSSTSRTCLPRVIGALAFAPLFRLAPPPADPRSSSSPLRRRRRCRHSISVCARHAPPFTGQATTRLVRHRRLPLTLPARLMSPG